MFNDGHHAHSIPVATHGSSLSNPGKDEEVAMSCPSRETIILAASRISQVMF